MRFTLNILLICWCFIFTQAFADTTSVMLVISPVADDFFDNAQEGRNPELKGYDDERIVIGTIDAPGFSVQGMTHVVLFDANGASIPLVIDKSSLYSEFNDDVYNSMRISFRIRESVLEQGALRLTWGSEISANNRQVDQISIYLTEKDRYRTFTWEERPAGDDGGSYAATFEVIVDDQADIYYLWYLLPMALIFALLFVKKIALK